MRREQRFTDPRTAAYAACLLFALAASAGAQSTDRLTVTGVLTNASSPGQPLSGGVITLRSAARGIVATGATGANGTYSIVINAPPSPVAAVNDVVSFSLARDGISIPNISVNSQGRSITLTSGDIPNLRANIATVAPPPNATLSYFLDGVGVGPGFPHTSIKQGNLTVRASFDSPLELAPKITITGPAPGGNDATAVSMTPSGVATQQRNVWFFSKTIVSGSDGVHTVALTNVRDIGGNDLRNPPANNTFSVDTRAPGVAVQIGPAGPGGYLPAESTAITATFSEDTNPVSTPQVSVVRVAAGGGNTLPPTPMRRISPTVWVFNGYAISRENAGAGVRDGDASIVVSGAEDRAGNGSTPATTGASFTIDTLGSNVSLDYGRSNPLRLTTGPLDITATFTDATSDRIVVPPRLRIVSAVAGAASTLFDVPMSPSSLLVFHTTVVISPGVNGPFSTIVSGGLDRAGNPNNPPTANTSLIIDTQQPSVAALSIPGQGSGAVSTGPIQIRVRFSEQMRSASTINVALRPEGSSSSSPLLQNGTLSPLEDAQTWISPPFTVPSNTNGKLEVRINGGEDLSGNALIFFVNLDAFVADTVRPLVASVSYSRNPAPAGPVTITATFTEPLASPPSIAVDRQPLGGSSGDRATTAMAATPLASVWTFLYTVTASSQGGAQDGLVAVSIGGGVDGAGNETVTTASNFFIDTLRPSEAFSVTQPVGPVCIQPNAPITTGVATITFNFSEPILTTPTISIDRPGTGNDVANAAMTATVPSPAGSTSFTFGYSVARSNGTTVLDGRTTVSVANARDAAGNDATPLTTASFLIDTTPPALCISLQRGRVIDCQSATGVQVVNSGPFCITATFSEPIPSGCPPALSFVTAGSTCIPFAGGPLNPTARPEVWTFCGAIPARCNSCPAGDAVTIAIQGFDASGNQAGAGLPILIDDVAPVLMRLVTSASTAHVPAGPLVLTATFSEALPAPPILTINRPPAALGTAGDVVATPMALAASTSPGGSSACPSSAQTWTFTYIVTPQNNPGTLDSFPGCGLTTVSVVAVDSAGNTTTFRPNFIAANQPADLSSSAICSGFQVDTVQPVIAFDFKRSDTSGGVQQSVNPDFVRLGFLDIVAIFTDNVAITPTQPPALTASGGQQTGRNSFFGAQMNAAASTGQFVLERAIVAGDDGTFKLTVTATDLAGNTALVGRYSTDVNGNTIVLPGRSSFGVDTLNPRAASFVLKPSRPAGATISPRPTDLGDRSELTVAISSGPVDVIATFSEPILISSTVPGVVPAPAAPVVTLERPRSGLPASTLTPQALVPVAATGSTSATVWTTRLRPIDPRGLPSFEDGVTTWTLAIGIDRAGNAFAGRTYQAIIDTVAPSINLSPETGRLTADNRVRVAGAIQDTTITVVTVSLPGTAFTTTFAVSPAAPSFSVALGPLDTVPPPTLGGLRVEVAATDLAGNVARTSSGSISIDTDGDGMPDDFEARATLARDGAASITGVDPNADDDGDGIANLPEFRLGTDPEKRDTDDDGVDDATEINQNTAFPGTANPLVAADNRPVALLARQLPARAVAPQIVALDGRDSRDPKGRALGYRWTLLSAPAAAPSSPFLGTSATAALAFAKLTAAGQYLFLLQVGNGSTFASPPATQVVLTVSDVPPRAVVGGPQVIEASGLPVLARLDGSASSDANGSARLGYSWRVVANPAGGATLEGNVGGPNPMLRVVLPGSYGVELTVTDPDATTSEASSATATAVVVVAGPIGADGSVPANGAAAFGTVSRAGLTQRVITTGTAETVDVTLIGHDSTAPSNPTTDPQRPTLDFSWSQVSGPAQATFFPDARGVRELDARRSVDPRARLFAPGRYVFRLQVSAAGRPEEAGVSDTVAVEWVKLGGGRSVPVADAGLDRLVSGFVPTAPPVIELSGAASRSTAQGQLRYSWTQVRTDPDDLTPLVELSDPAAARPVLVPPAPGDYRFELVVTDSTGVSSLPARVTIQVRSAARPTGPTVSASANDPSGKTLSFAQPAQITASGSPSIGLAAAIKGTSGVLSVKWRQVTAGSTAPPVAIADADKSRASFRPVVSGCYRFGVTVSDGVLSSEAQLLVPVDDLRPGGNSGPSPVVRASASVQVSADRDTSIVLDASGSFDRDRNVRGRRAMPLTFLWRQTGGPLLLAFDRTAAAPAVALPAGTEGRFTFECTIDDNQDAVLAEGISFTAMKGTVPAAGGGSPPTGSFPRSSISTGDDGGGCQVRRQDAGSGAGDAILLLFSLLWLALAIRRRAAMLVVAGLALSVAGPSQAAPLPFFQVTGLVTDSAASPRESVTLSVSTTASSPLPVKTNTQGRYSVTLTNATTGQVITLAASMDGACGNGRIYPLTVSKATITAADMVAGSKTVDTGLVGPANSLVFSKSGTVFSTGPLSITVTFNQLVFTLPQMCVDFAPAGASANDRLLSPVSFTNPSTSATFQFTVTPSTGDGAALIDVTNAQNSRGDIALPPTNPKFSLDTVQPQINSLVFSSGAVPAGTGPIAVTATFSEAITPPPLIRLFDPSGVVSAHSGPPGSPSTTTQMIPSDSTNRVFFFPYVVLGSPEFADTTATVSIVKGTDAAGNSLPVGTPALSATFHVDNRRPRVTLSVPPNAGVPARIAGGRPVTFNLDSDEAIDTRFPPRLRLDQAGTAGSARDPDTGQPLIDFHTMSPRTAGAFANGWTVTFSPRAQNNGLGIVDGKAGFTLQGGRDRSGNDMVFVTSPSVVVDSIGPRIRLSFNGKTSNSIVTTGTLTIVALATEAGTVTTPTLDISPPLQGVSSGMMQPLTGNSFRFVTTISEADGSPTTKGYTVGLRNVTDDVGNPLQPLENPSFVADTRPFAVTLTHRPDGSRVGPCPMLLTATFRRPVVDGASVLVTGPSTASANTLPLTTMNGPVPGTVFTAVLPFTSGSDGDFTVQVVGPRGPAQGGASDSAGNKTTGILPLFIDSTPPRASLSFSRGARAFGSTSGPALVVTSGPLTITATFSEAVTTGTTAFLAVSSCQSDPTVRATTSIFMTAEGPGTANDRARLRLRRVTSATWVCDSYAIVASTAANPSDGTIVFGISGAVDGAGNPLVPVDATAASVRADTVRPSPSVTFSHRSGLQATGPLRFDAGGPVTVQAVYSEPITGTVPQLSLTGTIALGTDSGSAVNLTTALTPQPDGRTFTASLAGTAEATLSVAITGGADLAGNTALSAATSYFYDGLPPQAVLTFSSPTAPFLSAGSLTVTASFSEALGVAPGLQVARRDGRPAGPNSRAAATMSATTDPAVFVTTLNLLAGDDGPFRFSLTGAADLSGNTLLSTAGGDVTIDTAPPRVTVTGVPALTSAVRAGVLFLTASFSEPLATVPTLSLAGPTASTINTVATTSWDATSVASVWTKSLVLAAGNDGFYTLTVANSKDPAGNAMAATAVTFQVDATAPLGVVTLSRGGATPVSTGPLDITIQFSEAISTAPQTLTLVRTLTQGRSVTYTLPVRPGATAASFVATLIVTDVAGSSEAGDSTSIRSLSPVGTDGAGNPAVLVGNVTFTIDTVPPRLFVSAGEPGQTAFSAGPLTLRVTAKEKLKTAPSVAIVPLGTAAVAGGTMTLASDFQSAALTVQIPRHAPPAAVDGFYQARLAGGTDLAGNAGVFLPGPAVDLLVDTLPPLLTLDRPAAGSFTSGQLTVSGSVTDATTVDISLAVSGALDVSPRDVVQARASQAGIAAVSRLPFSASADVTLPGCAQTTAPALAVVATDSAGNRSSTATRALVFDSDGDGLPDTFECAASGSTSGLDPGRDDDTDGLTNLQEYLVGTDPRIADTDGDGVTDGTEVQGGSDPRNPLSTPSNATPGTGPLSVTVKTPARNVLPQRVPLQGSTNKGTGSSLDFSWSVVSMPPGAAADSDPTFVATRARAVAFADLKVPGNYLFRLSVTDTSRSGAAPVTADLAVTVLDADPVAAISSDSGPDPIFVDVSSGSALIAFTANASFDANGDPLGFAWGALDGNSPAGTQPSPAGVPGLVFSGGTNGADVQVQVARAGAYQVAVTVSSTSPGAPTRASVAKRRIIAFAAGIHPPVARAGFSRELVVRADQVDLSVRLFGRDSVDPDRPTTNPLRPTLLFRWSQTGGPGLGAAPFTADARGAQENDGAASVDPIVRLTLPGKYTFSLTVAKAADPALVSLPDEVSVNVVLLPPAGSEPPRASAGSSRVLATFDPASPLPVVLDGTGSRATNDPPETLAFAWRQIRLGDDDVVPAVQLSDAAASQPSFVPPAEGDYEFELVVTDRGGRASLPARVRVRVINAPAFTGGNRSTGVSLRRADALVGAQPVRFDSPVRLSGTAATRVDLIAEATVLGSAAAPVFRWRQIRSGSTAPEVQIAGASSALASFVPPRAGTYRFLVQASAGSLAAATAVVVPVDDLGSGGNSGVTPRLVAPVRVLLVPGHVTRVRLDSSGSFDRDRSIAGRTPGRITTFWTQTAGPARPSFDPAASALDLDLPAGLLGTYGFELQLDDGQDMVSVPLAFDTLASPSVAPPIAAAPAPKVPGGGDGGCGLAPTRTAGAGLFDLLALLAVAVPLLLRRRPKG